MTALVIARAGLAHAELLSVMHAEAFNDVGERGWGAQEFADCLAIAGTDILLALDGVAPVGLVVVRRIVDEAEILTVCVLPSARGMGAGRFLMDQAIALLEANDTGNLYLEVRADNEAAVTLYKTLGFTETGVRANYFCLLDGSRRDALVMGLAL